MQKVIYNHFIYCFLKLFKNLLYLKNEEQTLEDFKNSMEKVFGPINIFCIINVKFKKIIYESFKLIINLSHNTLNTIIVNLKILGKFENRYFIFNFIVIRIKLFYFLLNFYL